MASIWEAVLASSAVSTVISTAVATGSSLRTERRQRSAVAHQLARSLEGYAIQCANEIVDADEAARLADKHDDDSQHCNRELPEFHIQSVDLDRLKPEWRDRISAFPNQINAEKRYLSTMIEEIDEIYEWKVTKQTSRAKLGRGGCAKFCVNGQSTAGANLLVRKHHDNQEARSTSRTTGPTAG